MYNDERMLRVCAAEEARGVVDMWLRRHDRDERLQNKGYSNVSIWNEFNFASEPIRAIASSGAWTDGL